MLNECFHQLLFLPSCKHDWHTWSRTKIWNAIKSEDQNKTSVKKKLVVSEGQSSWEETLWTNLGCTCVTWIFKMCILGARRREGRGGLPFGLSTLAPIPRNSPESSAIKECLLLQATLFLHNCSQVCYQCMLYSAGAAFCHRFYS